MNATSESLWDAGVGPELRIHSEPWIGGTDADVVVVGAGVTGLWTAYHLARRGRHVTVLERETVGFGASGRNGGWCSALFPTGLTTLGRLHGRPAAIRLQEAMIDTVGEVRATLEREGIDADVAHGGTVDLIRNPAQLARARARLAEHREFGFGPEHLDLLDPDATGERVRAAGVLGSLFTPHCLAVHPAKLVHGLARVVTALGVQVHERTPVTEIGDRWVRTPAGRLRAEVVVRSTEGYTPTWSRHRRDLVPLYSMMIATAPLPASVFEAVGLSDRPTFADHRHTIVYGQRTADDRIAFGGRGAPYHFGSAVEPRFDTDARVRSRLVTSLAELFPVLGDVEVTHHWGGPLGVPRDVHAHVTYDRVTGAASAGGYVGDGVATANLAGRTLADLITGEDSDLVRLPWVGHRSRRWEPEPLRWLGINGVRSAAALADRFEAVGRGGGPLARIVAAARRH